MNWWQSLNNSTMQAAKAASAGYKAGAGSAATSIGSLVNPLIGIAGGVISNILSGMNTRKARLYNTPMEQVKRLQEAGLPLSASSTLSAGGGITTKTDPLGTESWNNNLGSSLKRSIDKKSLQLLSAQIDEARAKADEAIGHRNWLLSQPTSNDYYPEGQTNQEYQLATARDIGTFNWVMQHNAQELSQMQFVYEKQNWEEGKWFKQFDAQLENLLTQLSNAGKQGQLLGLQIQNEQQMTNVKNEIYTMMRSGKIPSLSSIIYAIAFGAMNLGNFKY